jgi:hypothetical protein
LAKYLRIEWHPSKKDSSLGIVAISVAPECSTERPYLIGLVQTEGIVTGKLFGFFQRMDDDAEPVRIQELRELLKKGMDSGEVLQKLEDLRQIAFESRFGGQTPSQAISEKELERRFVEARLAAHLDDAPALFLIACPRQPVEFGKIFDSSSSKEAQLLEKPPKFRANGFDLSTYQKAEMVEAKLRRCAAHYRKSLELWKDGVLIFVAQGDSQFLGWGTRENGSSLLINNYAFTEVVTLFLSLCLEIYRLATPIPKELQVHLGLLSSPTKEKRYELSHHKISPPFPPAKGTLAPDADAAFDIRFNLENADVFTEAFRLLSKVYNWFGYPDDQIPYQEQGSNPRRIDRDKFR